MHLVGTHSTTPLHATCREVAYRQRVETLEERRLLPTRCHTPLKGERCNNSPPPTSTAGTSTLREEIAGGMEEKHAWKMAAPLSRSMAMLDGLISGCARMCSSAYVCTRARSRMRVTASLQVCVRCVCACKGIPRARGFDVRKGSCARSCGRSLETTLGVAPVAKGAKKEEKAQKDKLAAPKEGKGQGGKGQGGEKTAGNEAKPKNEGGEAKPKKEKAPKPAAPAAAAPAVADPNQPEFTKMEFKVGVLTKVASQSRL